MTLYRNASQYIRDAREDDLIASLNATVRAFKAWLELCPDKEREIKPIMAQFQRNMAIIRGKHDLELDDEMRRAS
jgi:hypothetical protein